MKKRTAQDAQNKEEIQSAHTIANSNLQKRFYAQKVLLICIIVFACLELCAVVVLYKKQTISIPYVVEINREGDIKYKENVASTLSSWTPSTATTIKVLSDFLQNLRSVSLDKQIQTERIKKVYAFAIEKGLRASEEYLLATSPMLRCEKERVEINVYATTPLLNGDDDCYQIDFNEKTFSLNETLISEQNYRAIMKIKHYLPKTEDVQRINPLGIYVCDLKISAIRDGYVIL